MNTITVTIPAAKEDSSAVYRAHYIYSEIRCLFGDNDRAAEHLGMTLTEYAQAAQDVVQHMERQVKNMNKAITDINTRGYSVGSTTTFVASANDFVRFQANIAKCEVLVSQISTFANMLNIGNIGEVFNFIQTGTAE